MVAVGSCRAQARYDNPVDKQTYFTPGEFKTYQPATIEHKPAVSSPIESSC